MECTMSTGKQRPGTLNTWVCGASKHGLQSNSVGKVSPIKAPSVSHCDNMNYKQDKTRCQSDRGRGQGGGSCAPHKGPSRNKGQSE
eukprot:1161654-Pelagomonas_calceolata.AAC.7